MNRVNAHPEKNAAPLLVPESTPVAMSLGDRLIAIISCGSDSGIDMPRLRRLLLIGLAVLGTFEAMSQVFPIMSGPARTPDPIAFTIINLTLIGISAFGLAWIGRNWRWWTLAFCIILMINATISGIVAHENDPVVMALLLLIITSAVTVPWNARWQAALGFLALGSFAANALKGVIEENDLQQWLILTALMAFAVSFAALKDIYRRQRSLIVGPGQKSSGRPFGGESQVGIPFQHIA